MQQSLFENTKLDTTTKAYNERLITDYQLIPKQLLKKC